MERPLRTRLTAREGRAFAFPVAIAFLILAGITGWRGHVGATRILGAIGGLLLLAGLVAPTRLGPVQRGWMGLARAISTVTTPVFMGLVYFGVLTPIGLVRRAVAGTPVSRAPVDDSYWHARPEDRRRSDLHRQF